MTRTLITALAVLATLFVVAVPASATSPEGEVLVRNSGLTVPTGAVLTSDGALWVGDGEKGVCRVRLPDEGPAGASGTRLVRDGVWCDPASAPALDKTGQMAFDPQTNSIYVAEADSAAGGIWRLEWDPQTGTIADGGKIWDSAEDLITGLAISYTGPPADNGGPLTAELNFTSKRTNAVRRMRAPESAAPQVVQVGQRRFFGEEEVGSIATLGNDLYLAEPFGVTRLTVAPDETPDPGTSLRAELIPGLADPFPTGTPSALAADPERGRIYAGTDNGNARDQIDALDPTTLHQELYDVGVAAVLAILVEDDGDLLVVDDPSEAAGADVNDQARVWRIPLVPLRRPRASWTQVPAPFSRDGEATFGYTARDGAMFDCSLDSVPWSPCGGPTNGTQILTGLAEGTHTLRVRAVDADPDVGPGPALSRTLVVDRTRPEVTIDNLPSDRDVERGEFTLRFSGNEQGLDFRCQIDDRPSVPCTPAHHTFQGLARGYHTVEVLATDRAGNESVSGPLSRYHFFVHTPAPPLPTVVAPLVTVAKKAAPQPPRGDARLVRSSGRGCVRGALRAHVSGRAIDRVGFRLDGDRIRVVHVPDRRGRFALRVPRRPAGHHILTALIRYERGSGRSERLALEYRSCAPSTADAGEIR